MVPAVFGPAKTQSQDRTKFLELCIGLMDSDSHFQQHHWRSKLANLCCPLGKIKARSGSQFWITYLPPHLSYDKNSSDRSTLQQIAFLLRNHGRWMANGRSTMTCSTCYRGLQCPDPKETSADHRPKVCVLTWSD